MDNNKEPNFKLILLSALTEPDYSIIEFWQKKQKETGYSEEVFYRKLKDTLKHYSNIIESKIQIKQSFGISVTNYKIPLLNETDFQVNGELGKNEINYLGTQLNKYYNSIFLSIEKLKECEFSAEQIERLLTWDEYETIVKKDKGTFYASNIERKIYSGIEAHKKIYFRDKQNPKFPFDCLDLIPDYYLLAETVFIEKQRNIAGTIFNEQAAKENFRHKEINKISKIINEKNELKNNLPIEQKFIESDYSKFEIYLQWLKDGNIKTNKKQNNKAPLFEPKLFTSIFNKPEIVDRCIDLLRNTDEPCINEQNEFLRNKGAFVVWIKKLEYKKIFNISFKNDIERAQTLNHNFKGLNISSSLFRSQNRRAKNMYESDFESAITAIKQQ